MDSTEPTAILSHLHRADGSATFSQNGYTVIGSVNGPIEVQRRDELPEEAAVDVIVRPAVGVGGALRSTQNYTRLMASSRYARTTHRDDTASYSPPAHPHPQLSSVSHSSHTTNY